MATNHMKREREGASSGLIYLAIITGTFCDDDADPSHVHGYYVKWFLVPLHIARPSLPCGPISYLTCTVCCLLMTLRLGHHVTDAEQASWMKGWDLNAAAATLLYEAGLRNDDPSIVSLHDGSSIDDAETRLVIHFSTDCTR